ncbi:Transcription initiation factor IIB [Linnemannia elongata]|nr:Transcription initiation factor IIB [Linnemannia elongata]
MERIDPRQQQQQPLHSNPPQSHHVRQLSREQALRPQSPLNSYPLREAEHRQAQMMQQSQVAHHHHPDERQLQYRGEPVAHPIPTPGSLPADIERSHPRQEHYRGQDHQQSSPPERMPYDDSRPPVPTDQPHHHQHPSRSMQPSPGHPVPYPGGPPQSTDPRFQHHRHPSGALLREGQPTPEENRGRDATYPQDERLQQYPPQNLAHQDGVDPRRTPIVQQRPASATENGHRGAPHDPRYQLPGPTQHNSAFIGHERRESYPQHPQEAPSIQPVAVHPGTDERHPQHPPHMHRGSLDAVYNPVRHPDQEPFPVQPAPPQQDPRDAGVVGQPPRHVPPYPGHSPEGRRLTADESMPFHHQNPPHQQQQLHLHQQSLYLHQQPPQPQHQQPHQYYAQHQNQQDYEQQPVPQEPEGHHSGRSSFSYPAPPPPPSSQAWQAKDAESLDEHGRPIDPRYPRLDSEMHHGVHGHRGAVEPIEHPPPERMIPGREPPSAIAQQPFPPNGQPQFPAGPESLRNGMVSPRDGVFNETPTSSTRSLSPESALMARKRGRRPKSKLDVDIAGSIPVVNSPSPLVPRPGPEIVPEQQRKRGRKSKAEPEVSQRNWNAGAHDAHRQTFGHVDSVMDHTNQDTAGHFPVGDDNQLNSRNGHHMEMNHGQPISAHHERPGQDVAPQDKRYLEDDTGRRSDPRYERQHLPFDDMSNGLPGNFAPGSVEEFEHIQRLRQQQEQRPSEQHLQEPEQPDQHRQQYSHSQAQGSPTRYESGQVHTHSLEAHSGHGPVEAQPLGPAGKEPETVQLLEADVANALVNIQHENRFQSPDGASYPESDPNKRLRLESPGRPIDPHAGHVHHRPYPLQDDPQAGPAPVLEPVAIGRDLAQDEQDTAIILQSMMNNRQAMEQSDPSLLHQGQAPPESQHPHFANGYPPRPASPRARGASQNGDPLQHQSRHSQHGEYPPVDPHPYGRRLQDPQMQLPHPPYGHGQAYQPSGPTPLDPHHGPVSDDHAVHQQHSSVGGAPQPMHPSQRGPESFHEHGGENNGVYHPSAPYPTDPAERDTSGEPRRSSNNNTTYAPGAVQPKDPWRAGSPPRGRNDVVEPGYNGHPVDQQHPPQHPPQHPQGHWPADRPDNRGPPPPSHLYGGDANAAPGSQELTAAASVPATPVKTKARGKAKTKAGGMMSPETTERPDVVMSESKPPANEREFDPRAQEHYPPPQEPFHPPQPTGRSKLQPSDTLLQFGQEAKPDTGAPYKVEPFGGNKSQTTESKPTSVSGKRLATPSEGVNGPFQTTVSQVVPPPERPAPNSLLFGSGMILVKKLHDASGFGTSSGSEGSTKFPPSQLSIKTGYDLSKATSPASSTFSPSTPLSAVATALAVKKKRSKQIDIKDEVIATSPGTGYGKNDLLPPPPPPTKGKGGNRGRKGLVLVGSTDADIERSNQITRSGGPAWLMMGANAASSSSNGAIGAGAGASSTSTSATSSLTTGGPASATSASSAADGPGIRRRAPLSPSTLLIENDKRKPKRIKIDDKDVRQVQRTSSTLTDATDSDRKDNISSTRKSAEDDEVDSNAEGAGGDCCSSVMGSQRRRLPEEDDEDLGEEEVSRGTAGNGAHGRRQSQGQSQNQSQPQSQDQGSQGLSQAAAGSKSMKRKSNASLAGTQLSKKAKEKAKAVDSDAEPPVKTTGKTEPSQLLGRSVVMGIPLKRSLSIGGSGAATPSGDTDAESDLAMEDDIKCPHIFGLDSESEHEIEEGPDDDAGNEDDDDGKSAVSTPGKVNGSSDQAGSSSSSSTKVEGALDPSDPLQVQGLKWVKTLGMSEKAWEETFRTYERVKRLKELKNRQPVRKRDAILAAILYIVCRDEGSPRTFSEICTASGVRRGDIGAYYRLMLKVLKPSKAFTASARDTDAEAFMTRWCESLSLPPQVRQAAIHVFSLANTLNLTSGKCPSSVGAAAIYLCIFSWNNARRLARCKRYQCPGCQGLVSTEHPGADQDEGWIRKEQKDVAVAVGVVSATLMGCFRNLAPESDRLVPADFLRAAEEGV